MKLKLIGGFYDKKVLKIRARARIGEFVEIPTTYGKPHAKYVLLRRRFRGIRLAEDFDRWILRQRTLRNTIEDFHAQMKPLQTFGKRSANNR